MKSEDIIDDLKQELTKKEKMTEDLKRQIDSYLVEKKHQEKQIQQEIKKIDELDANLKLNELNLKLQNEINEKKNESIILENENNELKNELNKLKERLNELNVNYEQQFNEINVTKDKEIQYYQNECKKLTTDNEKLVGMSSKLQQDKRQLEDELILYNEKKEAITKCEQQMNEILQMVNEERLVRDNLKHLASKLIQEVDTLRSQCIYATPTTINTSNSMNNTSNLLANGSGESNTNTWRNRCSERRDRINVQNLQVALEKEIQVKEELINENKLLKLELDLKQSRINELQLIIEDLNENLIKSNENSKMLQRQQKSDYIGYDNLANLNQNKSSNEIIHLPGPSTTNTTSISQLVNGDTLYAIDDDDDDDDFENSKSFDKISESAVNNNNKHETHSNESPNKTNKSTPSTPSSIAASSVLSSTNTVINSSIPANNLKYSKSLKILPTQYKDSNLSNSSTLSSVNVAAMSSAGSLATSSYTSATSANSNITQHRFEVITFQTMERCEYCCGILYGICRQAVKCKNKNCSYLCHTKCRYNIPDNCPININQRVQLKGVDFNKGIGTLMQGNLKIPKPGGVKKGWTEHYVFLSNARLFICPIIDNSKPGITPVQIVDIRDSQFNVSDVNESDVIHATKRDIPCIFKVIVTKLKQPDLRQQILFCAKDVNDKRSWINVLKDLNERLIHTTKPPNNKLGTIVLVI